MLPTLLLARSISDATFRDAWRSPKSLDDATVVLLIIGTLVFMAASLVPRVALRMPRPTTWPGLSDGQRARLLRVTSWAFWATIFGYLAMAAAGVSRGVTPQTLIDAVVAQDLLSNELKKAFAPIAGVTTFTQFGIAFVVLATVTLLSGPAPRLRSRIVIVVLLGGARSFLLSERLAVLELLVPMLALWMTARLTHRRRWVRSGVRAAPVILLPALLVVFGAFEYSRSWVYYAARTGGSFWDFAVERLAGYYVTSYNNGFLAITYDRLPGRLPLRTLEALWTAPVVDQVDAFGKLSAPGSGQLLGEAVAQYGNPEFNNPCGICDPFVDWGIPGGMVFLALAGLVLGWIYVEYCKGSVTALLIYPPLVTGLFELPRYMYWTQGRILPALAVLGFTGWYLHRAGRDPATTRPPERHALPVG